MAGLILPRAPNKLSTRGASRSRYFEILRILIVGFLSSTHAAHKLHGDLRSNAARESLAAHNP